MQTASASAVDHSSMTADATLDALAMARRDARSAEARVLGLAAHWADLHGVLDRPAAARSVALPGAERLVPLGGDGTPEVAEFAPAELGAVLGVSEHAASALVADALDLRHRLPLTWARVQALEVEPWVGRKVAQATRRLDAHAAAAVDRTASRWADRLTWGRLEKVVLAAVVAADPSLARADAAAASEGNGVWVGREVDHGTGTAFVRADAADLARLDTALDQLADQLHDLGDDSGRDARRARGLGILADQQPTLDLAASASATGAAPAQPTPRRRRDAVLYVHVTADTLAGGQEHPVARVEGIGPVVADTARRWLGDCHVTVRPVVDLAGIAPVDAHEIPDRVREAVHLAAPADAFPFAASVSRRADLDHTEPWQPPDRNERPPGQTRIGNLAKLTRRHHRIKTHGRWAVRQPYPGILLWRTPHGRTFLVDHTGTRQLR